MNIIPEEQYEALPIRERITVGLASIGMWASGFDREQVARRIVGELRNLIREELSMIYSSQPFVKGLKVAKLQELLNEVQEAGDYIMVPSPVDDLLVCSINDAGEMYIHGFISMSGEEIEWYDEPELGIDGLDP